MKSRSENKIKKIKSVHCFGVGGIGVSALARMYLSKGVKVSGSDLVPSSLTRDLEKEGLDFKAGQEISHVPGDCDLIIYSAAIEVAEPEFLKKIKESGVASASYSEALGILSKDYKTIAVSGTHGKTTTTAMIAKILSDAGLSPTVLVGSILKEEGTNFILGDGEYFVVEADEYRRNFITLSPSILVITNIDLDHLDYYKDLEDIQKSFSELADKLPQDGVLVTDLSLDNVLPVVKSADRMAIDYGSLELGNLKLLIGGNHNILNAKAAVAVASLLGIDEDQAEASLERFQGTARRFELKGKMSSGALVYDDYAHNPQKIRAMIAGAKEMYPDMKITVVFQPHLYSRTKSLFNQFVESLKEADKVIVTKIFPAREAHDPTVNPEELSNQIKKFDTASIYIEDFSEIAERLNDSTSEKEVVILTGAGDIYVLSEKIVV